MVMRYKCIGCEVLARPIYQFAADSLHVVDIELLPRGLHDHPFDLRERLQERIDQATSDPPYDAILLGYGLCGQSTAGLVARQAPLVVPRAHDCITLFLGSRSRYTDEFGRCPGTYWYTLDYIERRGSSTASLAMGAAFMEELQASYDDFVRRFGKDNADYLMEVYGGWAKHYQRAVYIDLGIGDGTAAEELARQEAGRRGWSYETLPADLGLVRRLIEGEWRDDFLVVPPGRRIEMTYDDAVVCCAGCTGEP